MTKIFLKKKFWYLQFIPEDITKLKMLHLNLLKK